MENVGAAWNERFAGKAYLFGIEPNRFVVELCSEFSPGRALDLGCGEGRNAVWLANRGHEVVAVDIARAGLVKAARLGDAAGVEVEWIEADLREWVPEPSTFDLVLLCYLQLPEESRVSVHRSAAASLVDGGRLVLIAHHLDNLSKGIGGPPTPDVLFTEEDLRRDFSDLHVERLETVTRPVESEAGVRNAIDVICIARK